MSNIEDKKEKNQNEQIANIDLVKEMLFPPFKLTSTNHEIKELLRRPKLLQLNESIKRRPDEELFGTIQSKTSQWHKLNKSNSLSNSKLSSLNNISPLAEALGKSKVQLDGLGTTSKFNIESKSLLNSFKESKVSCRRIQDSYKPIEIGCFPNIHARLEPLQSGVFHSQTNNNDEQLLQLQSLLQCLIDNQQSINVYLENVQKELGEQFKGRYLLVNIDIVNKQVYLSFEGVIISHEFNYIQTMFSGYEVYLRPRISPIVSGISKTPPQELPANGLKIYRNSYCIEYKGQQINFNKRKVLFKWFFLLAQHHQISHSQIKDELQNGVLREDNIRTNKHRILELFREQTDLNKHEIDFLITYSNEYLTLNINLDCIEIFDT